MTSRKAWPLLVSASSHPLRVQSESDAGRYAGASWGGWGCRETPPVGVSMLLTIKDLAERLRIKPGTLYSWAAQGKIPCRKIHGLVRFDSHEIDCWLSSFSPSKTIHLQIGKRKADNSDLNRLIASVKREVYTSGHGETRPKSGLIGKGEHDGALEA